MKGTSSPRSRHLHKHINATQACPREVTGLDGDDDAKKKMLKMSMFNRNVRGQLWSVVGLLAMVVVGASVYSGYSDISTLTIQIPSIATPFSSGNRIIPPTGGRKSTKTPTKTKTEIPFFQSLSREENADIEHGEKYSIRKQSAVLQHARGKLLPCRPDDANSCFQKTTSDPTDRVDNDYLPGIVLFNPLERARFWCGKWIPGRKITLVDDIPDECRSKIMISLPYVYSKGPPAIENKEAPIGDDITNNAVELFYNTVDGNKPTKPVNCAVPCRKCEGFGSNYSTVHVANTNWIFKWTMEGESYLSAFKLQPTSYRKNIFYATTSFKSEVPLPYMNSRIFDSINPAVDFDKVIKGASFLARNCHSKNNREAVVKALFETDLRIDSISSCLHNANPPPGVNQKDKGDIQKQYLFHLAFENQNVDDYITEKLWGTLQSGTLPVYMGAPNIRDHVPKNSIIVAQDFEDPQALADYLIRLTKDRDLYESYHKWRDEPIGDWFYDKYDFTKTHDSCRMCKFVYARQHGLGWNHSKQEAAKPRIDHKTCRNAKGLIEHPFKESWLSPSGVKEPNIVSWLFPPRISSTDATKTCSLNDENRVVEVDHGVIRRKIFDRDGVTDLIIDVTTDESRSRNDSSDHYILRLETPLSDKIQEPHVINDAAFWIQDDKSRFYVMISGIGDIKLSAAVGDKPGTIEISIPLVLSGSASDSTTTTVRVRIVTEDIDHFHQDAQKFPTYFGDLMMQDFFHPIEFFQEPTKVSSMPIS